MPILTRAYTRSQASQPVPEPTTIVEFHIFKSLPDNKPTIVKREYQFTNATQYLIVPEALGPSSSLEEVLWNFSLLKGEKRLTLEQNPHFYKFSDLPASREEYVGRFRADPINDFRHPKICVLVDKSRRIFLETEKNKTRAFGNVWMPNNVIILKGSSITFFAFPSLFLDSFSRRLWKA